MIRIFSRLRETAALFFLAAFLAAVISGCAPTPVHVPQPSPSYPLSGKSYVIKGKRYYILASADGFREKGVASWYGKPFHGRKTASGEVYDMYDLTAAHKTLPLQTWVVVRNPSNNREVTVRVNDRGPFARGRVIDLSYAAAKKLGMVSAGTALVVVQALGKAEERVVDGRTTDVLVQPESYSEGRFSVQIASLQDKNNAYALAKKMKARYGRAYVVPFDRGDAMFYRVQVADKKALGQAMAVQNELEKSGYPDCFVVAR